MKGAATFVIDRSSGCGTRAITQGQMGDRIILNVCGTPRCGVQFLL